MTQEQQDWREVRRLIMHLKPQRRMIGPKSGMRKYVSISAGTGPAHTGDANHVWRGAGMRLGW